MSSGFPPPAGSGGASPPAAGPGPNPGHLWLTYETRCNAKDFQKPESPAAYGLYVLPFEADLHIAVSGDLVDALRQAFFPGTSKEEVLAHASRSMPWRPVAAAAVTLPPRRLATSRDEAAIDRIALAVMPYNILANDAASSAIGTQLETSTGGTDRPTCIYRLQNEWTMWETASRSSIVRISPSPLAALARRRPATWPFQRPGTPAVTTAYSLAQGSVTTDFSIKTGVNHIGSRTQSDKAILESNALLASMRSDWVSQVHMIFGADPNLIVLRELLTVTYPNKPGDPHLDDQIAPLERSFRQEKDALFKRRFADLRSDLNETQRGQGQAANSLYTYLDNNTITAAELRAGVGKAAAELAREKAAREAVAANVPGQGAPPPPGAKGRPPPLPGATSGPPPAPGAMTSVRPPRTDYVTEPLKKWGDEASALVDDLLALVAKKSASERQIAQARADSAAKVYRDGFQVRELAPLIESRKAGNIIFPPLSIPFAGRAFHAEWQSMDPAGRTEDFVAFWKRAYAVPLGRAKAEFLLRYGLQLNTPNPQNMLLEFDARLEPTGRVFFRDIGDAKSHAQVTATIRRKLEADGRDEAVRILAYEYDGGPGKPSYLPFNTDGRVGESEADHHRFSQYPRRTRMHWHQYSSFKGQYGLEDLKHATTPRPELVVAEWGRGHHQAYMDHLATRLGAPELRIDPVGPEVQTRLETILASPEDAGIGEPRLKEALRFLRSAGPGLSPDVQHHVRVGTSPDGVYNIEFAIEAVLDEIVHDRLVPRLPGLHGSTFAIRIESRQYPWKLAVRDQEAPTKIVTTEFDSASKRQILVGSPARYSYELVDHPTYQGQKFLPETRVRLELEGLTLILE